MARLEIAFDFAMEFEAGGVTHTVPGDPGGTTKWGISQRANPDLDIPNLTREDAIEVYRQRYWDPRRMGELISQEMANELFEFTINADPANSRRGRAVKAAQIATNLVFKAMRAGRRVSVDGVMGPDTLDAMNYIAAYGPLAELAWDGAFNIAQLGHYRGLRRDLVRKFLLGWTRRVVE